MPSERRSDQTSNGAIAELRNVRKAFGNLVVLKDLDLCVGASERLAIIGPSGSGKSTILRLLMTLDAPTAGQIVVDGEEVWRWDKSRAVAPSADKLRRVRGKVGMVFQQFNLFPHMNVMTNVSIAPMRVLRLSREDAEERATELLRKVGLSDKIKARPAELSGGQQQRVAIARALAMQPKIMLFDEVTSALDPELVGEVLAVLRDLATSTEMAMAIVTHEMRFARDISDRVIFIDDGEIVEQGHPQQVFTDPVQTRTRAFLRAVLQEGKAD